MVNRKCIVKCLLLNQTFQKENKLWLINKKCNVQCLLLNQIFKKENKLGLIENVMCNVYTIIYWYKGQQKKRVKEWTGTN